MTHDQLAASLAKTLRSNKYDNRVTWENLGFSQNGVWQRDAGYVGAYQCRPDVFSIRPTLDVRKCQPWTHEVKVTRSDFFSDVKSGKYKQYAKFSCRLFFAVPAGLVRISEVPSECGLWEYASLNGWLLTKKAAHCKDWQLTDRHLMKLILGRWGTRAANLPPIKTNPSRIDFPLSVV